LKSRPIISKLGPLAAAVFAVLIVVPPALAQQRPLLTEDPEPIGAGRILIEGGLDYQYDRVYPVSGLEGNLWRPTLGVSLGISSIAEFQIDGGPFNYLQITSRDPSAPIPPTQLSGNSTHDVDDVVVATKIRVLPEAADHPAFAFRFATRLPNAEWEKGIGLDTTDFLATLLIAKTVESVRIVGNIGGGILGDPTFGHRQNDVLLYGVSLARAITDRAELVGEITGRESTRRGAPFPGTENRSLLNFGGRYTRGSVRFDAAVALGLTAVDPTISFTAGFTYVFNAFNVP
jgi:hypothetical protein